MGFLTEMIIDDVRYEIERWAPAYDHGRQPFVRAGLEQFIKSDIKTPGRDLTERDFTEWLDGWVNAVGQRKFLRASPYWVSYVQRRAKWEKDMRNIDEEKMLRKLAVRKAVKLQTQVDELHDTIKSMNKGQQARDQEFRQKWDTANVQQQQHQERLMGELSDYRTIVEKRDTELSSLRESVVALDAERMELRKSLESAARTNDAADMEAGQLRANIRGMIAEALQVQAGYQKVIDGLNDESQSLRNLVTNMRDANAQLIESESQLQADVKRLTEETVILKKQLVDGDVLTVLDENQSLKNQVEAFRGMLAAFGQTAETLAGEKAKLETRVAYLEDVNNRQAKTIEELTKGGEG